MRFLLLLVYIVLATYMMTMLGVEREHGVSPEVQRTRAVLEEVLRSPPLSMPTDAWGTKVRYHYQHHQVVSAGPDRTWNTWDDIQVKQWTP